MLDDSRALNDIKVWWLHVLPIKIAKVQTIAWNLFFFFLCMFLWGVHHGALCIPYLSFFVCILSDFVIFLVTVDGGGTVSSSLLIVTAFSGML